MYHFKCKPTKIQRLNKKNCSGLFTCGLGYSRGPQTAPHQAPSSRKFSDFGLPTEKCITRAKSAHDRGSTFCNYIPIKHLNTKSIPFSQKTFLGPQWFLSCNAWLRSHIQCHQVAWDIPVPTKIWQFDQPRKKYRVLSNRFKKDNLLEYIWL